MFKFRYGILTAATIVAVIAPTLAQKSSTPRESARTEPSAATAGANISIQTPRNGETVTSPFKVQLTLNRDAAPPGVDANNPGRHHLFIDTPLAEADMTRPIKSDAHHIPFRKGQIATMVTLPPGKHTLQFVLADAGDVPFKTPMQSQPITITVKDSGATAAANADSKEADAKTTQDSRKAAEARQAQEAKAAQETRDRQAAEQAIAAKEAREVMAALEARKALEAKQALEAKEALEAKQALEAQRASEAKQALEAKLAKEEEASRLALARQAREAQRANEARQAEQAKRPEAARQATAHLGFKHAKTRRHRSAMAHLKTRRPMVLHPALQEIQRPARLHQGHHHHRARGHTSRLHHVHAHTQRHDGQVHHHRRHHDGHHHCHRRHHHHPNERSHT